MKPTTETAARLRKTFQPEASRLTYPTAIYWLLCVALGTVTATAFFYGGYAIIALGLMCLAFIVYIQAVGPVE